MSPHEAINVLEGLLRSQGWQLVEAHLRGELTERTAELVAADVSPGMREAKAGEYRGIQQTLGAPQRLIEQYRAEEKA